MSRRPDSSESVKLAIELLRRIPRRPHRVTAATLHQQLADAGIVRDKRTVQRQLQMLTEHFDIECHDDSRPYGYCWKEKSRGFSLLGLSAQESLLLMLAEQHLKHLLPTRLLGAMESFFHQARSNLVYNDNSHLEREWLQKVRVVSTTQPLLPPVIDEAVFVAVSDALFGNRWLEVAYVNRSGKLTEARVMPLGLAQQGVQLYLVCRFQGYDNERSLALHRFQSARATSLGFERPRDFDLEKYDSEGRFGYGEGERVQLRFLIEREAGLHLLETPLSQDQRVNAHEEGFDITATVVDSAQLQWWLNSFGSSVSKIRKTPLPDSA